MNKTIASSEVPVTERELNALIKAPASSGGCCSIKKPKDNVNEGQPAVTKTSCCCH